MKLICFRNRIENRLFKHWSMTSRLGLLIIEMKVKFTRSQGNGSPQHDSSKIKFRLIISLLHFLFARTALASFNVGFNFRFAHRKRSRLFGLKMVWKKIDLRLSKSREKKSPFVTSGQIFSDVKRVYELLNDKLWVPSIPQLKCTMLLSIT